MIQILIDQSLKKTVSNLVLGIVLCFIKGSGDEKITPTLERN